MNEGVVGSWGWVEDRNETKCNELSRKKNDAGQEEGTWEGQAIGMFAAQCRTSKSRLKILPALVLALTRRCRLLAVSPARREGREG